MHGRPQLAETSPIPPLAQLVTQLAGILTALGPALGEIGQVWGESRRAGPARRIHRGLLLRQVATNRLPIQTHGARDLPNRLPSAAALVHRLLRGPFPGDGCLDLPIDCHRAREGA